MWEHLLHDAGVVSYVSILVGVAIYGFHRYVLVYLYLKHRNHAYVPPGKFEQLPRVTVQLPMYNEDIVAERIIRASCQIDYPLDLLEIQVLDDSTDHSAVIAREACEQWAAKGFPVKYIHRENRVGYKAGALAEGLKQASGEFIAIFDADFVPPRDILQNVINYFTDDQVGMPDGSEHGCWGGRAGCIEAWCSGPALEAQFADRLSLERLPPFAPMLNPVEQLWSWLKYSRLNNFAPRDPAELDGRVIADLTAVRGNQSFLRGLFHASELPIPLTLLS